MKKVSSVRNYWRFVERIRIDSWQNISKQWSEKDELVENRVQIFLWSRSHFYMSGNVVEIVLCEHPCRLLKLFFRKFCIRYFNGNWWMNWKIVSTRAFFEEDFQKRQKIQDMERWKDPRNCVCDMLLLAMLLLKKKQDKLTYHIISWRTKKEKS